MTPALDSTHDPDLASWVATANGHPLFPIQNLPCGIYSGPENVTRIGVAIGDCVIDAAAILSEADKASALASALEQTTLNAFFDLPRSDRVEFRKRLSDTLSDASCTDRVLPYLCAARDITMHLPFQIGDYSDFYVGVHHATNIGRLFRPDNPLLSNYKYVPIGYHGRASSIRLSGVPVHRPAGQLKAAGDASPSFRPSQRLDYELELGLWIGRGNALGRRVPINEAWDHMAGLCLLNDWSARDIQAWEYQPLGPFLSKNFHTTVSPWVVTTEALAPYRCHAVPRSPDDPAPLPYLIDEDDQRWGRPAIELTVDLLTEEMRRSGERPFRLSVGDTTSMYWTLAQILAHHASNGCNLAPGDLLGTGTLSMPTRSGFGSLMELTVGGAEPLQLANGERRSFLQDGDEIILSGVARASGRVQIGFGECRARVVGGEPC